MTPENTAERDAYRRQIQARKAAQRRQVFRNRQLLGAALAALLVALTTLAGSRLAGWPGAVTGCLAVAALSLAVIRLLLRQARRDASRQPPMRAPEGSISTDETGTTAPPPPAPAFPPPPTASSPMSPPPATQAPRTQAPTPPPPKAPASAPPQQHPPYPSHREAGHFPRPLGTAAKADLSPWRLPGEPGPSAISADSALAGGLQVRAASIVGPGHRCEEPATPRQDAYRLTVDASGRYLVVAVADGMSDSSHSHLGANVAANALVQHLWTVAAQGMEQARPQEWFVLAARQMIAAARQRNLPPEAVRTAVLTAVVELDPDQAGNRRAWLASIADVSAWVRRDRGWRQVAGDAKQGLDGGRLREFLPYTPRAAGTGTVLLGPHDVLALTTDGIGDVLGRGELAAWFAGRWERPPHISDFIDAVGFEAKGELDDRTAVVLWCTPSGRRP